MELNIGLEFDFMFIYRSPSHLHVCVHNSFYQTKNIPFYPSSWWNKKMVERSNTNGYICSADHTMLSRRIEFLSLSCVNFKRDCLRFKFSSDFPRGFVRLFCSGNHWVIYLMHSRPRLYIYFTSLAFDLLAVLSTNLLVSICTVDVFVSPSPRFSIFPSSSAQFWQHIYPVSILLLVKINV